MAVCIMHICLTLVCLVTCRCTSVSVGACALLLFAGATWHTVKCVHVCSYVCLGLCVLVCVLVYGGMP